MLYFLETGRLGFRSWAPDDLELALGLWGDPAVTRMIDARSELSPEDVREKLRLEIEREQEHGVQYWPIFFRETGEHAGCCGLRPYGSGAGNFELGFHIRSAFWRMGIAEEAARGVIDHAFEHLNARSLFAGHHPRNLASAGLLGKLGFAPVGSELYPPTGLEHPTYVLSGSSWRRG